MNFLSFMPVILLIVSSGQLNPKWIDNDAALSNLQKNLPEGWKMHAVNDSLIIENLEPIWVLSTNLINAPSDAYDDSEENKTRIIEHGKKSHAQFIFTLKKKNKGDENKNYSNDFNAANYFSQNYALYELMAVGCDNVYTRHYPWGIENEASTIYSVLISKYLITIKGPEYPEVNYARP